MSDDKRAEAIEAAVPKLMELFPEDSLGEVPALTQPKAQFVAGAIMDGLLDELNGLHGLTRIADQKINRALHPRPPRLMYFPGTRELADYEGSVMKAVMAVAAAAKDAGAIQPDRFDALAANARREQMNTQGGAMLLEIFQHSPSTMRDAAATTAIAGEVLNDIRMATIMVGQRDMLGATDAMREGYAQFPSPGEVAEQIYHLRQEAESDRDNPALTAEWGELDDSAQQPYFDAALGIAKLAADNGILDPEHIAAFEEAASNPESDHRGGMDMAG